MILAQSKSYSPSFHLYLAFGSLALMTLANISRERKVSWPVAIPKPTLTAPAAPAQELSRPHSKRRAPTSAFENFIQHAARENGLDPRFLKAVIQAESQFNQYDISPAGACGLMQLMPHTARLLQVTDIFDPEQNIRAGAKHLRYLLIIFSNNMTLALAAYNAGEGPVRRYRGVPPYRETQNYVSRVLKLYRASLS